MDVVNSPKSSETTELVQIGSRTIQVDRSPLGSRLDPYVGYIIIGCVLVVMIVPQFIDWGGMKGTQTHYVLTVLIPISLMIPILMVRQLSRTRLDFGKDILSYGNILARQCVPSSTIIAVQNLRRADRYHEVNLILENASLPRVNLLCGRNGGAMGNAAQRLADMLKVPVVRQRSEDNGKTTSEHHSPGTN